MSEDPHGKLVSFGNLSSNIAKYYNAGGLARGLSTGWSNLDVILRWQRGTLTIISGIPSSGKSEWMDQVMLNSVIGHNWHWTVFSPENWPLEHHFQKMAEKWIGKPMFNGSGQPRMTAEEVNKAVSELGGTIVFAEPPEGHLDIDTLLALVSQSKKEFSTDAFLLDPWNELEHHRPPQMTETEHIGNCLTKLRNFARRHDIAIFVVAHPTKLQKKDDGNYPVPTPYDISGSANWRNKADICIAVWRDYQANNNIVHIHVQKVRNKNLGEPGMVELQWKRANGLFFETSIDLNNEEKHGVCKRIG